MIPTALGARWDEEALAYVRGPKAPQNANGAPTYAKRVNILRILAIMPILGIEFLHIGEWLWWETFRPLLFLIENRFIHSIVHLWAILLLIAWSLERHAR